MKLSKTLETKIKSLGLGEPSKIEGINHFDFSSIPLQISYIKKEKESHFDGDFYNLDLRKKFATTAKAGKLLRKFFPNVKDDVLRNKVPLLFGGDGEELFKDFELSDRVCHFYLHDNYDKESGGSLGNSCMRYQECQKSIEMYEEIGVKILVLHGTKGIKGRAVIWEGANFHDNEKGTDEIITFMDRIYIHDDANIDLFKEYARAKGYFYKVDQDYEETKEFKNSFGETVEGIISFKTGLKWNFFSDDRFKLGDIKHFPYMDTLMNISVDGTLMSYASEPKDKIARAQDTGGTPSIYNYTNKWGDIIDRYEKKWSPLYKQFIAEKSLVKSRYHDAEIRNENSRKIIYKGELDFIDSELVDKRHIVIHNGVERLKEEIFDCHNGSKIAFEECPLFKFVNQKIKEIEEQQKAEWESYKKSNWNGNKLKISSKYKNIIDLFIPIEYPDFIYPCGTNRFSDVMKSDVESSEFITRIKSAENIYLVFNNSEKIIQIGIPRSL
jgi:hypothetical protein